MSNMYGIEPIAEQKENRQNVRIRTRNVASEMKKKKKKGKKSLNVRS